MQLPEGTIHGSGKVARRVVRRVIRTRQLLLDEVRDDLGVRVGGEAMPAVQELLLERLVVLDDAVMDDDDGAGAIEVRVRVGDGHAAVGGPARVTDPDAAGQLTAPDLGGELTNRADLLEQRETVLAVDRHVHCDPELRSPPSHSRGTPGAPTLRERRSPGCLAARQRSREFHTLPVVPVIRSGANLPGQGGTDVAGIVWIQRSGGGGGLRGRGLRPVQSTRPGRHSHRRPALPSADAGRWRSRSHRPDR